MRNKIIIKTGLVFLLFSLPALSQEKVKDTLSEKLERPAFESSFIINNPNNVLFSAKTLEIQIKHRFGLIKGGENDLFGIWAPSNIRLGVSYAVSDRFTLGFGTTKFDRLQDFSLKAALLRQTRSDRIPISISYYGNMAIDARKRENFDVEQDRFSFFNQLIVARRFGPKFSLQIAPNISHYNLVEQGMKNDKFSLAIGGRYKVGLQTSILFDYNHPFNPKNSTNPLSDVKSGVALGVEFSTAGHAFQIFVGNYSGIVNQKDYMYNQFDFFKGDMLLGFNITRAYSF